MSAVEKTATETLVAPTTMTPRPVSTFVTKTLDLFSSVRFGVVLLAILVVFSMAGMLVMQQEIEGFDRYYAELTPSQRLLGGWLGLFDIYHTWYFNLLLLVLSLNIVLASIDRFPKAWSFIQRPKLDASPHWLRGQNPTATVQMQGADKTAIAAQISQAAKSVGWNPRVTEKGNRTFVFAERQVWNRLGAYAVHVALLLLFLGSFVANFFERTGTIRLAPGTESRAMTQFIYDTEQPRQVGIPIPFTVECTDIEQRLRERAGNIMAGNTLDWITRIRIKDGDITREATVSLNNPYDYRGYRFFQASFIPQGSARTVNLRMTPANGGETQVLKVPRYGAATLGDGTQVEYIEFFPDFTLSGSRPTTRSNDYNNPAVQLKITSPTGATFNGYAFATELPAGAPVGAPVGGYKLRLAEYEKVPLAHVLSVKYDPLFGSTIAWYIGGPLLILALCGVFFASHQRVWAAIDERGAGEFEVVLGANTNRNQLGLEDRFKKLIGKLGNNFTPKV
jgi:cytochrome c biogenesis protein